MVLCHNDKENSAYSELLMSSSPGTVLDVVQTVRVYKRVRFQNGGFATELISNDLKPASEMSDNEKSLIWWRDCDYYVFKKRSKMIAKELLLLERADSTSVSYCSLILRTYSVCCQTAEESHDDCTLSDQDRRRLELLSEKEHCRRGLERWRFPDLAMERSRRQSLAIRGVIDVQDRFVKCMNLDFDTGADFMRKSSERLTRPARLFARLLGEADTIAAQHVWRGVT